MLHRPSTMAKNGSFAEWMNKKVEEENREEVGEEDDEEVPFLTQIYDIQSNFTSQMQELAGGLPESGPLSAAFRNRLRHSMYLFLGSLLFAILAIFIGIPTIAVRPSKFSLCLTLSTLLAVASIVVLQKPSVFLENLRSSERDRLFSVISLCFCSLGSIYITVFIHRYVLILIAAACQILCILWFLASFIPGGSKGLVILLRACYAFLKTAFTPILYICSTTIKALISRLLS
jgi:hypothetical protein